MTITLNPIFKKNSQASNEIASVLDSPSTGYSVIPGALLILQQIGSDNERLERFELFVIPTHSPKRIVVNCVGLSEISL